MGLGVRWSNQAGPTNLAVCGRQRSTAHRSSPARDGPKESPILLPNPGHRCPLPQGVFPMTLFRRTILVLVALVFVGSPASAQDSPRVPTIDDLLNIDSVGGVRISPNGKWVAYTVTHSDFKKDAFLTHLWIAEPASGRNYQLTRG